MDSEISLRMENWRGRDWDEKQNGAHVMRRKGCAMQNQGIIFFRSKCVEKTPPKVALVALNRRESIHEVQ